MSAVFAFALQPLLEYRRSAEEAARVRFSRCRDGHNEAARTLAGLEDGLQRLLRAGTDAARLQCCSDTVEAQRRTVARCLHECEAASDELVAAAAACRAVETLRDWRFAAYRARRERRSAADLDDANVLRGHSPS